MALTARKLADAITVAVKKQLRMKLERAKLQMDLMAQARLAKENAQWDDSFESSLGPVLEEHASPNAFSESDREVRQSVSEAVRTYLLKVSTPAPMPSPNPTGR